MESETMSSSLRARRRRTRSLAITTAVSLLIAVPLAAADPPRNQVPYVSPEMEKLRTLAREQQLHISNLKSQIERLGREFELLKKAHEKSQATIATLQADLSGEQARTEALRNQVATLDREFNRPRGNRKELVGAWKVVSVEENGSKREQAVTRLVFTPSSVTFQQQEPGRGRTFTYRLDPDAEPKELDVYGGEFRPTLGIYRLIGDQLTLCVDERLAGRPAEFQTKAESGTALWVLVREAGEKREGATRQVARTPASLAHGNGD